MADDRHDLARSNRFAGAEDRRDTNRYPAAYRIARLKRGSDVGLAHVRNVSDGGMMVHTDMALAPDEKVEIMLSANMLMAGRIVWSERGRYGVAFLETQDAEEIVAALMHEQKAESYRAQRLPVDAEAILATSSQAYPIDLIDISANGAGFRTTHSLEAGQIVELLLPGDDVRRTAVIRWSKGDRGGLWFSIPLDRNALALVRGKGRTH